MRALDAFRLVPQNVGVLVNLETAVTGNDSPSAAANCEHSARERALAAVCHVTRSVVE